MPVKIRCTSCKTKLSVPSKYIGKERKCPKCDHTILILVEAKKARSPTQKWKSDSSEKSRKTTPDEFGISPIDNTSPLIDDDFISASALSSEKPLLPTASYQADSPSMSFSDYVTLKNARYVIFLVMALIIGIALWSSEELQGETVFYLFVVSFSLFAVGALWGFCLATSESDPICSILSRFVPFFLPLYIIFFLATNLDEAWVPASLVFGGLLLMILLACTTNVIDEISLLF
ncbi:MAG: hypothetical protein COA78_13710 [Blastopirellula sp.]|nr:MAG: hypothetical protein COA78_13710 [Blastopirellula sp.]